MLAGWLLSDCPSESMASESMIHQDVLQRQQDQGPRGVSELLLGEHGADYACWAEKASQEKVTQRRCVAWYLELVRYVNVVGRGPGRGKEVA